MNLRSAPYVTALAVVGWFFAPDIGAGAQEAPAHAEHHRHADVDGHAGHSSLDYERSFVSYNIPALTLIDQNGKDIRIDKLLNEDRPTLIQFIFTSCTTICPVMGAVFGGAQEDISALAPDYRMVSISIDPEYDTPARLREFAQKQGATPEWILLTGSVENIDKIIKAFDVLYLGDNKMYHQPYTFIRWKPDDKWVRLRGLLSVSELTREFANAEPKTAG